MFANPYWQPGMPQPLLPGFCPPLPDCRYVMVAGCELDGYASQSSTVPMLATFQLRSRDQMDFAVDFTNWLSMNGNTSTVLTAATWAVALGSPKTPTIAGQAFNPAGKCAVILEAPAGAVSGDTYWLDVTVNVGPTTIVSSTDVPLPARVITRRIAVVLVNG